MVNAPSPEFDGLCLGDYFESFLRTEWAEFGYTNADLLAWRPEKKGRGGGKKGKMAPAPNEDEATE